RAIVPRGPARAERIARGGILVRRPRPTTWLAMVGAAPPGRAAGLHPHEEDPMRALGVLVVVIAVVVAMASAMAAAAGPALTPTETVEARVDQAVRALARTGGAATDANLRRAEVRRGPRRPLRLDEVERRPPRPRP